MAVQRIPRILESAHTPWRRPDPQRSCPASHRNGGPCAAHPARRAAPTVPRASVSVPIWLPLIRTAFPTPVRMRFRTSASSVQRVVSSQLAPGRALRGLGFGPPPHTSAGNASTRCGGNPTRQVGRSVRNHDPEMQSSRSRVVRLTACATHRTTGRSPRWRRHWTRGDGIRDGRLRRDRRSKRARRS